MDITQSLQAPHERRLVGKESYSTVRVIETDYQGEMELLDHNEGKEEIWLTFIGFGVASGGIPRPSFNYEWATVSTWAYKDTLSKDTDSL